MPRPYERIAIMSIDAFRHRLQERERALSPFAARDATSKGRERSEEPRPFRTAYQEDRDRIVRSKAFRRLKHKTQVFIAPLGDHYLTRLTHTMEVSLLARTVTRALNLNEDLAEAVSMGHDVGHAPFGHLGEQTLAEMYPGGFRHNRQSLRVVDVLENDGRGLNLTWEVRQGILRHSKGRSDIEGQANPELDTLEAQAAKIADALAYINHDTDDAIRAGIISEGDLPASVTAVLGRSPRERLDTFIADLITASWAATGDVPLPKGESPAIRMSHGVSAAANTLREFLFQTVYLPASDTDQAERAREVLRLLYRHFAQRPELIPEGYSVKDETPERMALDYVSGMTDAYALRVAESIKPGVTDGFLEKGVRLTLPTISG